MDLRSVLICAVALVAVPAFAQTEGDRIMLADPLDEPEYYCFDLTGFRDSLVLDDPLQAHTCKAMGRGPDQLFAFEGEKIQVVGYDRCLQAAGTAGRTVAGASILARECTDTGRSSAMQRFELGSSGKLRIKDTDLCVGVGASSTPANGPSHIWRALIVLDCDADDSLSKWQIGLNQSDQQAG